MTSYLQHAKRSENSLPASTLIADDKRAKNAHRKTPDTLYSEAEWQTNRAR